MDFILECNHVTKCYGRNPALWDVSFAIAPGRIVGLLGPNGSGKTTLIKTITGLLTPDAGIITVCGNPIGVGSKALVSYLPDKLCFDEGWKVGRLISYYSDFFADFDAARARGLLADLRIGEDCRIKALSKGNKEKLQLIMVMSRRAKLYILDEPIAGVDPAARDYILNTVISNYDREASILISTHLIADVENVLDNFIFLRDGRILQTGVTAQVHTEMRRTVDDLFREVFR